MQSNVIPMMFFFCFFSPLFIQGEVSLRAMPSFFFFSNALITFTHSHMEAVQYKLICHPF